MEGFVFYVGIWVAMIVATILEVVIRLYIGGAASVFVVGLLASAQAIAVALFYQNLREDGWQLGILPLAAVGGLTFLAVSAIMTVTMGM